MVNTERLRAALKGETVDYTPQSFWRHFYTRENSARDLAAAMIEFQHKFDWDLMKVNPRASYHVEPWGAVWEPSTDPLKKPKPKRLPITKTSDWDKIKPLPPDADAFGEMLEALDLIKREMGDDVDIVQTVFSPLSVAADMCESDEHFKRDLMEHPELMHHVHDTITQTLVGYVREVVGIGISGIFFATTEWGTTDAISVETYNEFGRPYDLRVLDVVSECEVNVLHVCKANAMLYELADYPVHVLSWDLSDASNPSVAEAAEKIADKAFIAGIDRSGSLRTGTAAHAEAVAHQAIAEAGTRRFVLGASCALHVDTPDENLAAVADAAKRH
jgi:uroporphyrinogen decarboxylase